MLFVTIDDKKSIIYLVFEPSLLNTTIKFLTLLQNFRCQDTQLKKTPILSKDKQSLYFCYQTKEIALNLVTHGSKSEYALVDFETQEVCTLFC